MQLPTGIEIFSHTPIYPGSHFTWGEATKDCTRCPEDLVIDGRLIATSSQVTESIIQFARYLDQVRELLGNRPLYVNSWYRPSAVNRRVGGAKWSRHLFGDAADIRSNTMSAYNIYHVLNPKHQKGGLGKYSSFVHLDLRGHKARWG